MTALRGRAAASREALAQAPRAEGAHLLVVGEDQGERRARRRAGRPSLGREVGGEGEEALHVAGAAGHPAVALVGQGEGVALPALLVGGDDVHVAGEHEPAAVRPRARADPGDQVGLRPSAEGLRSIAHAGPVEVVGEEVGERQVAVPAGRVEGDQAGEQVGVGEEGRITGPAIIRAAPGRAGSSRCRARSTRPRARR